MDLQPIPFKSDRLLEQPQVIGQKAMGGRAIIEEIILDLLDEVLVLPATAIQVAVNCRF